MYFLADLSLLRRLAIYQNYHPTKHAVVQRRRLGLHHIQQIMYSDVTPKLLDFMDSTWLRKLLAMPETS
jgi:hypothetical protein